MTDLKREDVVLTSLRIYDRVHKCECTVHGTCEACRMQRTVSALCEQWLTTRRASWQVGVRSRQHLLVCGTRIIGVVLREKPGQWHAYYGGLDCVEGDPPFATFRQARAVVESRAIADDYEIVKEE